MAFYPEKVLLTALPVLVMVMHNLSPQPPKRSSVPVTTVHWQVASEVQSMSQDELIKSVETSTLLGAREPVIVGVANHSSVNFKCTQFNESDTSFVMHFSQPGPWMVAEQYTGSVKVGRTDLEYRGDY